ncbi:MAG: S41 family peptidase [Ramlibacter sp.]
MKLYGIAALVLTALLTGCGGGDGGSTASTPTPVPSQTPQTGSCSLADQKTWLAGYMRDQYFWYDRMGTPNAAATSIDAYFTSMLYSPLDRYSYTQPKAAFDAFYLAGTRTGYGYSLAFTDGLALGIRVRAVEPGSPIAQAGMRRGDHVLSIDGLTPAQIANGGLPAVSTVGVPRTFVLRNIAGEQRTVTVTSATFSLAPVKAEAVLDLPTPSGPRKVAYMAYDEFIFAGNAAMGSAFTNFAAQGVTELVLDLRYNGGGEVGIARNLASMIGGSRVAGQTFAQLLFNAKHPENNQTVRFADDSIGLPGPSLQGLQRVFIIASASTASASELLINSLKPFVPVVLIGGTTYGKPYGFTPVESCGTVFTAVTFETVNAQGIGGYSNGIAPTCTVADDLNHALGDPAENRIAAALYYAANGTCPPVASVLAQREGESRPAQVLTEGQPPGMWQR